MITKEFSEEFHTEKNSGISFSAYSGELLSTMVARRSPFIERTTIPIKQRVKIHKGEEKST